MNVARKTFSLNPETAENLDFISSSLGVSCSGLVNELLTGACADMLPAIALMSKTSKNSSQGDLVRLRGASREVLQARLRKLGDQIDAL